MVWRVDIRMVLIILFGASIFLAPINSAFAQDLRNRYIVILKSEGGQRVNDLQSLSLRHGFTPDREFKFALKGFRAVLSRSVRMSLSKDSSVLKIVKDRKVSLFRRSFPRRPGNGLDLSGADVAQGIPSGVARIGTVMSKTAKIDGSDQRVDVDVAIIDTGIAPHSDLNIAGGANFSGFGVNRYRDTNGHGTHVAGTVAALDNEVGVVGVAPGARLWAVRVLGRNGSGSLSDVISGIDWVTEHADAIEVANMSLGSLGSSDPEDPMRIAIQNAVAKGVVFVVAAGNDAKDAAAYAPAAFPEALSVSAIADSDGEANAKGAATEYGGDDTFATFSNFGQVVDIAAPGVDILSTWLFGQYNSLSGTSMASPHVTGAVALRIAAKGRAQSASDVEKIRNDMIANSSNQSGANGFRGDPDGFKEPLLSAAPW